MSNSVSQTIGFYGYIFSFPLGFIGHTFSLITFLSKTLRITSTGFLFICLTFSDILYQLISILDFITQTLQIKSFQTEHLCRFRTFILNFSTFTSAWILVLISTDRLIRVCFPHQQRRICTRKIAAISVGIVCICSILFTCHVLQTEFAYSIPISKLCGPNRNILTLYSNFYFNIWPFFQLFITYFIPCCLMIISLICIRIKLYIQQNHFERSIRREQLEQQMFILLISSIIYFSICTLSYSIHRIIYQRFGVNSITLIEIAILTIFLNMNYCYNFYIHCLTSNLFRQKFIQQLKYIFFCWKRQINNTIYPLSLINRPHN